MLTQVLTMLLLAFILQCQLLSNAQELRQASSEPTLPDFIAPCYRDDPMLSKCINSTIYGVIRKLVDGIPELDIPPIEPLFKDEIDAFNVAGLSTKISNITIRGVSKLNIVRSSASAKTKLYVFEGNIDKIEVNADYEISGFFIFIPIHATGTFSTIARHIDYNADVKFDVLPKQGMDFVKIRDVHMKVHIGEGSGWISNLGPFEVPINGLLNSPINTRFLLNHMTPIIEETLPNILEKFSNRIFSKVPYDKVLPQGTGPDPDASVEQNFDDDARRSYQTKESLNRIISSLY